MAASTATVTRRTSYVVAAVLLGLLALSACGGDSSDGSSATEHNDADVAFAQEMIPHHAQAVQMVRMTQDKGLDPEVAELAEGMAAAQEDEITRMQEWLEEWGEEVPDASMQDMGHHGDQSGHGDQMPGMMSEQQMGDLAAATGRDFQSMWLEMMIEHHEGAIVSARTQQDEGLYGPAVELAEEIERSQTEEIEQMRELLGQP